MLHKEVISEITSGNGDQFSLKEILQAKIRDDKDFQAFVKDKFEKGTEKIAVNKTRIEGIIKGLVYGLVPIITVIFGIIGFIITKMIEK